MTINRKRSRSVSLIHLELKVFPYIQGYVGHCDDLPDGVWQAKHVEAVNQYNKNFGAIHDWYDIQGDYINWSNTQEAISIKPIRRRPFE